ncbi:uncharacterized protein PV06_04277 [Exophiala oligosperma]|uniref:Uncharacterized protein n=2 Tax=Chaetothyriales TaxID=34395 RepID=A0A0D2DL51_9EURO|nr:uncharacterized protein PV06_04277 [Exophiala oligosperma]KAJ9636161.1 hypothetical protein H2204_005433 [Knufia peltigerae]KIW43140.1 hypothetical protein PV06_04277 [Exophiala oligosperma]
MATDAAAHPQPQVNVHHRKIELQTPDDFTYLQRNLIASAQQKLDLHFPLSALQNNGVDNAQPATIISLDGVKPTEPTLAAARDTAQHQNDQQEDPLRARVRQLVDAFMTRTWEGASQNITVNGMNASEFSILANEATRAAAAAATTTTTSGEPHEEREGVDFVYESYDSRLQSRVAGLYGELEALTAQVSKLRRTAPSQAAKDFSDALMVELARDDERYNEGMARAQENAADSEEDGPLKLKTLRDGWHDDVQAMYESGIGELAVLSGLKTTAAENGHGGASLTETVGKVQRARTVAMEFE